MHAGEGGNLAPSPPLWGWLIQASFVGVTTKEEGCLRDNLVLDGNGKNDIASYTAVVNKSTGGVVDTVTFGLYGEVESI